MMANEDVVDAGSRSAGAVGAAIPVIGAAGSKLPQTFREQAAKKVAQALGATKERFKAIAERRAPEILRRGLRGSRASLLEDATTHAREAGQAIDDVLSQAGGQMVPTAPIVDVKVVDTIGAGDTFHAGFLSWLEMNGKMSREKIASLSEAELSAALFFANKAASLVCSKRGAEPPTMAEMDALKA